MSNLKYVTTRYCRLNCFTAAQCSELWELWKVHATTNPDTAKAFSEAEKWMGDLSVSEEKFGEALLSLTDGVPGCLVELFCSALGVKLPITLALMVERHYDALKAQFALENAGSTRAAVTYVVASMEQGSWAKFADHGLAPSREDAPSAPVTRLLFDLIRRDSYVDSYGQMLTAMAGLQLSSGSFEGAVFEEKVRFQFLRGFGFRVATMVKPEGPSPKKKTKKTLEATKKPWTESESKQKVMFTSPAHMVMFDGKTLGRPRSYSPQHGVHQTAPKFFLFVPHSQTFPSINMSIAEVARKKGKKKGDKEVVDHVDLYHGSVPVSSQHFATLSGTTWGKAGHLPLDLSATPPTILRSPKAQAQLRAFRDALEAFPEFEKATLNHDNAGKVDDKATDLGSLPASAVDEDFYVLQLV